MMMRTKVLCLTLCLALLLAALPLALGETEAPVQTRRLRLGSSIYTIEIDSSYAYGKVTEEDAAGGQVAYLSSQRLAVDFDVYQRAVDGEQPPLAEYVAEAAKARGNADEIVADGEINGIPAGWFHTVENYDGVDFQTVTYVLDDGEGFVEVTFWLDGEDAETVVQGIINTLDYDNLAPVRLGSSPYYVFCSASFHEGGMTSEDVADDQVAYWVSDETLLDFDVYQFSKADLPEDLADYVTQEAGAYAASAFEARTEVNDIPVGWYRTVETYEGQDYDTLTCVLDAGDQYVEIVFWLDGLTAGAEADAILHSLWREDEEAGDSPDEIEAWTEEAAEAAGEWAEEAEAEAGEALEAAEAWAGEAAEAAGEWAEEAAAEAGEALEAAEAWAGEAAEAAGEWAEEAAAEAGEALEAAEAWAGEAAEAAGEWAEEAETGVGEALEAAGEWLEGALNSDRDGASTRVLRLGTSPFTIVVPAGFTEGEMTQEDIEDDQVGYYYSNETLLDFDVYQFSKDGYPNDLATYTEEETSGYNSVSELVTDGEINGVPAAWYRTVEEYQNAAFNTLTYILDGGDEYVEVCFWLDGDTADDEAKAIIRTLGRDGDGAVAVGAGEETAAVPSASADAPEADDGDETPGETNDEVAEGEKVPGEAADEAAAVAAE